VDVLASKVGFGGGKKYSFLQKSKERRSVAQELQRRQRKKPLCKGREKGFFDWGKRGIIEGKKKEKIIKSSQRDTPIGEIPVLLSKGGKEKGSSKKEADYSAPEGKGTAKKGRGWR